MPRRLVNPDSALGASVWYTALACVMTWPLVRHLGTGIAENLADPLLNAWILGWDARSFLQILQGHLGALVGFWNANIFYPAPLTLAYSEHLVAQAVQILPVYAATGNLILCYNLLFLSTFVLSALGAFLLVRELSGSAPAGFLAGLLYGFALYRMDHLSHVQVLSSQWMPLVLFGVRRYFVTRRPRALAGAALALVAQNLSCGYYLVFFDPFVAAYVLYEVWTRRLFRDRRTWIALVSAGAFVVVLTVPFLLPYLVLRQQGIGLRAPGAVDEFAADVYGYLTAAPGLRFWGPRLQTFPRGEGALFFGVVPIVLAMIGVAVQGRRAWRATAGHAPPTPDRLVTGVAAAVAILAGATAVWVLYAGQWVSALIFIDPALGRVSNYLAVAAIGLLGLAASTPRVRALVRGGDHHSAAAFYAFALAGAVWLSFGRRVRSMGYVLSRETVYDWLYRYVPGFDGLRVPSRYAMLAALFLAVLAGFGAAAIARRGRVGRIVTLALGVLFLAESARMPLWLEAVWSGVDPRLQGTFSPGAQRMYEFVNTLPAAAVIVEFPFGERPGRDTCYMYASTLHWRRLVNGYSGSFPLSYEAIEPALTHPLEDAAHGWQATLQSGATHAIVHESLFSGGEGKATSDWLRKAGAREIMAVGSHRLFALPAAARPDAARETTGR